MAFLTQCDKCGKPFCYSASHYRLLCDECDGTNDQKRAEEARWKALTADQKCEELLARLTALENEVSSGGLIG